MKSAFQIQLSGFAPASRDAVVRLVNQATGSTVERKPFLDGSLTVRDLDPGLYEMEVRHPNLIQPIDRRRIRLFPQPTPTRVSIPVPETLFRDTPIRDIPDANLTPVQQAAASARDQLTPLGAKASGEVIRASDWNQLVGAVSGLAGAVLELTQLVAPKGHDHPEIAEKITEVQENLRRFAEAYGKSLLELRREIETQKLDKQVDDVLDAAGASDDVRVRLKDRLTDLQDSYQADTSVFTGKLSVFGSSVIQAVQQMADEQDDPNAFISQPIVQHLTGAAQQYTQAGRQIKAESELNVYRQATTKGSGQNLGVILRKS